MNQEEKNQTAKSEEKVPQPEQAAKQAASPAAEPEVTQKSTSEEAPEEKKNKVKISSKFKDLVEQIEKLSALELSELVKTLEDHFGVSATATIAAAPAPAGSAQEEAAPSTEEKSTYTLVLTSAGDKKIEVIKAVREISGLGLAESKNIVDNAPKTVKENVNQQEAEEARKKLEAAGATVELK